MCKTRPHSIHLTLNETAVNNQAPFITFHFGVLLCNINLRPENKTIRTITRRSFSESFHTLKVTIKDCDMKVNTLRNVGGRSCPEELHCCHAAGIH